MAILDFRSFCLNIRIPRILVRIYRENTANYFRVIYNVMFKKGDPKP